MKEVWGFYVLPLFLNLEEEMTITEEPQKRGWCIERRLWKGFGKREDGNRRCIYV
jgi:hypothetical protein